MEQTLRERARAAFCNRLGSHALAELERMKAEEEAQEEFLYRRLWRILEMGGQEFPRPLMVWKNCGRFGERYYCPTATLDSLLFVMLPDERPDPGLTAPVFLLFSREDGSDYLCGPVESLADIAKQLARWESAQACAETGGWES